MRNAVFGPFTKSNILYLVLGLTIGLVPWRAATAESNVLFIFDASGSMKKKLESGEPRMDAAKKAMTDALGSMPADVRLGLLLFGHRKAKDCTDIELVSPIGADDAKTIATRVNALEAKGETPLAGSLRQALRSYAALKGQDNRIVMVTDGVEECGGDVCAVAKEVRDAGFDLKVDIVGFTLTDQQKSLIQCVPEITGGQYYDAQNMAGLKTVLTQVAQKAIEPPKDTSILVQSNGGMLLVAPNDEWLKLNDGMAERATTYAGEGIWAFKDGKPATFDNFEMLISAADQYNVKDFELLVGDEGPGGTFRSIGQFVAQNMVMAKSPYQKFVFPAVTARFLKVALKTDQGGGYIAGHEFKVEGAVDESSEGMVLAGPPQGIDLLAQTNGGQLVAAPNDEWTKLNDGKADRATTYAGAGVWAFKDGKPATFDTFELLIPETDQYNLKDFELLAGDEGPTGTFRSIGKFSTLNAKMMQSPYQRFNFAPVTAKYLKVVFETDHGGGYIAAHDLRLFGEIDTSAAAAVPSPAAAGINLLSQSNGGVLLGGPNKEWDKLNDGQEERATTYTGEGIWAFKDEAAATFDTFEVLIPGTDQYNLNEFELLAAADSPTGPYLSIGQFTVQNMKMIQSPYQRFTFAPVTAKYLKVVLKTDQGGGYIACYEFRLFGQPAP